MAHYTTELMTMKSEWQNISRNDEWVWEPVSWDWWLVVQLVLAIVGILGNLLVMLVIFWSGRRRCATDILIGALAVADFLTSVFFIPLPEVTYFPNTIASQIYCKIIHFHMPMWICICASVFTLTAISVERLIAVRFPFWFQRLFSPRRTQFAVIIIWVASFFIISALIFSFYISNGECKNFVSSGFHRFIGVSIFLIGYVLPVIIMVTAYSWTIYTLRQRRSMALRKAQNHVLQMLLIVVITFIVCWTLFHFGFLVFNFNFVDSTKRFSPVQRCFVILAFTNSCVNPFIYAAKMPSFRQALIDVLGRKGLRRDHGRPSVFADEGKENALAMQDRRNQ